MLVGNLNGFKNNTFAFKQNKIVPRTYTEDEVRIARTKKTVSQLKVIALGVGIIYFAMKRNFKINREKLKAMRIARIEKLAVPKLDSVIQSRLHI